MLKSVAAWLTGLTLLALNPTAVYGCQPGNPSSLAYIRRDNNRCEGISDRPISASDTFDLISFSTTNLTGYPNNLTIRVPGTGKSSPNIILQSYYRNYRLDNLSMRASNFGHTFSFNTKVLQKASIPINTLRATATINRNGQLTYYPVVLGQSSGRYTFVIESPRRTTFPTVEIRYKGQEIFKGFKSPITTPRTGQTAITWHYGNAPQGLYELYMVDGKGQRRLFRFEHNRKWF